MKKARSPQPGPGLCIAHLMSDVLFPITIHHLHHLVFQLELQLFQPGFFQLLILGGVRQRFERFYFFLVLGMLGSQTPKFLIVLHQMRFQLILDILHVGTTLLGGPNRTPVVGKSQRTVCVACNTFISNAEEPAALTAPPALHLRN